MGNVGFRFRATGSAAVGRAHADPGIADLLVVHHRVVHRYAEPEHLRTEAPDRAQQCVRGDDAVALRQHQVDAGVDQRLLGVEDVEGGALANARFLAHAVERDLGRGLRS